MIVLVTALACQCATLPLHPLLHRKNYLLLKFSTYEYYEQHNDCPQ
jgi:hypothetical protein